MHPRKRYWGRAASFKLKGNVSIRMYNLVVNKWKLQMRRMLPTISEVVKHLSRRNRGEKKLIV